MKAKLQKCCNILRDWTSTTVISDRSLFDECKSKVECDILRERDWTSTTVISGRSLFYECESKVECYDFYENEIEHPLQ